MLTTAVDVQWIHLYTNMLLNDRKIQQVIDKLGSLTRRVDEQSNVDLPPSQADVNI